MPGGGSGASRTQTARDDEVRNYEIAKKVTHTITRSPRVVRLSAAILVDGVGGKPRSDADVRRLSDLAKHATVPVINALTDLHHPCQALALAQGAVEFFAHRIRPIRRLRPVRSPRAPELPPVGS